MSDKIKVGIIGASGYSGQELLKLLARHPLADVKMVTSTQHAGKKVCDLLHAFKHVYDLEFVKFVAGANEPGAVSVHTMATECDVLFLSVPHGKAMAIVKELTSEQNLKGAKCPVVIDISADYRLDTAQAYEKWYKRQHTDAQNLDNFTYGLVETNRENIKKARFIANPGCYATAIELGLFPAVKAGILADTGICVDAKSGISGAGKNPAPHLHYPEMNENIQAYKIGTHQHLGEITQELEKANPALGQIVFVPHIVPLTRGIFATMFATVKTPISQDKLDALYREFYADSEFVRILDPGQAPRLVPVEHTNFCDISVHCVPDSDKIVITSCIDNLVKGAAGQAVQNMNVVFGIDEKAGLL